MDQVLAHPIALSAARRRLPAIGAWALGFAPLVLLAFQGGGYDTVVRSQAGIAVWWVLALGVLVGAVRPAMPGRRALVAVVLLAALGAWSWIDITASESAERTLGEVARIATYLGVFLLALMTLDRWTVPALVVGVASAIGLIATLAVLSRLQPQLFPANETGNFLPIAQARLNWPLNYWNGLAALCALGIPLLLALAASARSVFLRAAAAGLVPVLALCIDLTISRGGIVAAALAVLALLVLAPQRVRLLATLVVASAASAILIAAAAQRDLVHKDLAGSAALSQGDELTVVLVVVALGAGFLQLGLGLLESLRGPAESRFSPRQVGFASAGVAVVAVVVAVALGAPGQLADAWDQFKDPGAQSAISTNNDPSRLGSLSSNGRYDLWSVAIDALKADPVSGTGPGTYEFTWLRDTKIGGTVQDAHSLYLELGAEAGWPGILLGVALVVALLSGALAVRRLELRARWMVAAGGGALIAFAFSAGVDWMWELPVIPVAALLLAAAAFATRREPAAPDAAPIPVRPARRIAFAVAALVPIGLLTVVLAGSSSVQQSQASARAGSLPSALGHAIDAHAVDPSAATPLLQSALVREQAGDLTGAAADARQAARREPDNWRNWLVVSRLEARTGHAQASVAALQRARKLNPNHPLLRR